MNIQNDTAEANVNRWWWLKRIEFNNGLLISGGGTFILFTCWLASVINFATEGQYFGIPLFAFVGVYIVYLLLAHLLFTSGWVADVWFNHNHDDNFRKMLFRIIYWVFVTVPPLLTLSAILFVTQVLQDLPY